MAFTPHVSYSGRCREAFELYAQLFAGELFLLAYRDTPMAAQVPPEWADKIVHGTLRFRGGELAGSDVLPEHYRKPQGFSVLAEVEGVAEARRVFNGLAAGGSVVMPIAEQFWSPAFGVLVDRFDVPWEINGRATP
jgi:PhnB protein